MSTRTDATKKKLFDAAVEVIGERGFTDASVDEIVERAGVSKGTVYYHYDSKSELVAALIADRLQSLVDEFRRAVDEHPDDPREAMRQIVRAELTFLSERGSFARLLITEMWREDRAWRETQAHLRLLLLEVIGEVLQNGVAKHVYRDDIDPDFAASALFGLTATTALDWITFSPDKALESVVSQIEEVAYNAVRPC